VGFFFWGLQLEFGLVLGSFSYFINPNASKIQSPLRDFDDLPMDDLDGSNDMDQYFVYGDDIPSEENVHQINAYLCYSH
jgi:hypothetical protein